MSRALRPAADRAGALRAEPRSGSQGIRPLIASALPSSPVTIVRNAPPPSDQETRGRKTKHPGFASLTRYPFDELDVGDAFDVPIASGWNPADGRFPEYNRLTAAVSKRNTKHPETRFLVRMLDDYRVRCWRLA